MSGNIIEYFIRAKDETKEGIASAINHVKAFAATVARNLVNVQAGFSMLAGAVRKALDTFKDSLAFERMTFQFKSLVGTLDDAKKHMEMLEELGKTPPFNMEQFASASRELLKMTGGMLGYRKELEMLGDFAAATGQDLTALSHAVGLAYTVIRDGQPLERATMEMVQMGVVTKEQAQKWADMQKAGASNKAIWEELTKALDKYKGASADLEKTTSGTVESIQAELDEIKKAFTDAIMSDTGLGKMLKDLLDWIKKIQKDGTIEEWAHKTARAIDALSHTIGALKKAAGFIYRNSGAADAVGVVKGVSRFAGTIAGGEGIGAAMRRAQEGYLSENGIVARAGGMVAGTVAGVGRALGVASTGNFRQMGAAFRNGFLGETAGIGRDPYMDSYDASDARIRREAATKHAIAESQRKQKEEEDEKKRKEKIQAELAKKQAELDAQRRKEREKAEAEAAAKQAALDSEAAKKAEELAKKRIAAEMAERKQELDGELRGEQKSEMEMTQRLNDARQQAATAWGWYRDKNSLKTAIAEEKANAAAEKNFASEFDRLQRRRDDWRTASNLSLDDEAVRRVAVARENVANAAEQLADIQGNVKRIADEIDEYGKLPGEDE